MKKLYKKICVATCVWLMLVANIARAQEGFTTAFAFGGGATVVDEMRYASDGDLYFVARMGGKNVFAGTNYDAGGYGQYPLQQWVFGKVSPAGQQTLLKVFDRNASNTNLYNSLGGNHVIDKDGNLYSILTSTFPGNDYGDGHVETGYGAKIAKVSNTGTVQWVKPINTGVNINYGEAGTTLPNVNAMQIMDNGDIYAIVASNNKVTDTGSQYFNKYPTRIIKYTNDGDEVWHHELFGSSNSSFIVSAPKQFVDNNGNLAAAITITSSHAPEFISGGTTLTATNPYNGYHFSLLGIDSDGNRKWFHSATLGAGLKAVDPADGTVYVAYGHSGPNNTPPPIAPYNTLPNINPAFSFNNTYMWSGMLKLDITTGNIINAVNNLPATGNKFLSDAEKLHVRSDGSLIFYSHRRTFSMVGEYLVPDNYNALIFTDGNYNVTKVSQAPMPKVEMIAESNTNFAVAGGFTAAFTLNSGTVTPFLVDTDFGTRFPLYAAAKTDSYIAQGNINQIAAPKITRWTGAVSTAWNDTGNWSDGIADISTTAAFDANVTNQPTVSGATTVGRIIINNGVTASLPASNLTIKSNLTLHGTLKIPVSGFSMFSGYNAVAIDGNGTLEFNGTGSASSFYSGSLSPQLSLKTNVPLSIAGTFKALEFVGSSAKITTSGTGIIITGTAANAINGASSGNYVAGKLTRSIVQGVVYDFPVGTTSYYLPASINTNTITGTTQITVEPKTGNIVSPDINIAGATISRITNNGYWAITPNVQPASGSYSLTLEKRNSSNGDSDLTKYVLLKTTPNSSNYSFEGTLTSRTQTGGTGSNPNFSNSTISVTQDDLTSFNDFAIAVASVPVLTPLAAGSSVWNGNSDKDWNNAANWSNGVPNSTIDAHIPAGLSNYPLIYNAAKSYLKSLTIEPGVNVNLSDRLIVSTSIINNGIITVNTTPNAYSALPVRATLTGSGKVVFEKTRLLTDGQSHTVDIGCDVEINIGNANSMNINGIIKGNLKVVSGLPVNTATGDALYLTQPVAATTLQITAPINHIPARVKKAITQNGSFDFPIGNLQTSPYTGGRKYGAITITNHNIVNTKQYEVWFDGSTSTTFTPLKSGNDVISSFVNSGYWNIVPDAVSTTGTIDIVLKTSDYTNGRTDVNDYVLVRENNSAASWSVVDNAVITENSGMITVTANNLAPISTAGHTRFYIGIKASTTTWTGNANNGNWNTASNWSNGIPNNAVKAVFNSEATNFPTTNIPTNNGAATVEIQSGVTLSLPSTFYTAIPIINNGTIDIKMATSGDIFYGFGSGSTFNMPTGTGTIKIRDNLIKKIDGYYFGNTIANSVEVNLPAGLSLVRNLNISGNLNLVNGIVTVPSGQTLNITNPSATVTGSTSGYIYGTLNRTINTTGSYTFPVGSANAYTPATLQLNNIVGPTTISTKYSTDAIDGQPNLTIGGHTVNSLLTGGSWEITPSPGLTGGSYDATLSAPIGSSNASDFVILKRPYNYSFAQWENQGINQPSSISGDIVTAAVTGLTSFSQFGIGELPPVVLPVTLVKFTAKPGSNSVLLNWETASEHNNAKFIVERSSDGQSFLPIGDVAAKGKSNTLTAYTLRDTNPLSGINYYRLKQIDLNGAVDELGVRQVTFNMQPLTLILYPNPVSTTLHFGGLNGKKGKLIWYNISGQNRGESPIEDDKAIVPLHLTNGLYLVKIVLNDATATHHKVNIYR